MTAGRQILGRLLRLLLFALVAAAAVAFVVRTRGRELGPVPQVAAPKTTSASSGGYYILFRLARKRAEAQEEALLRTIAQNTQVSASDRERAAVDLTAVARAAREETEVESVLAGQGFASSAVVISGGGAMVVVPAAAMSVNAARRIGTDLWNLAGIAPEHVLIRPRA